ncbi:hypothetical protein, partial [Paracidovorax cattleyae]|uniref:hypothetical protein n=1 Tax=Paracidovorax cattleyae TaxID=80868 RepID=UPI001E4EE7A2
ALRVADMAEGVSAARALVHDAGALSATQDRALAFTQAHRGARGPLPRPWCSNCRGTDACRLRLRYAAALPYAAAPSP